MQKKILFALLGICLFVGCKKQETTTHERIVNVGVVTVLEEQLPIKTTHSGILSAKHIKNCAFKIPGRINKIHIQKGEKVEMGHILVSLNTTEYQLAYDNVKQIEHKAKQAFTEAQSFFAKLLDSKNAGGISNTNYEKARLDMEVKKADHEQAMINTALQKKQLEDCHLKADMDGIVLDIYPIQGELVDAGTLILNMRSNYPVAEISVNSEELKQISIGDSAQVNIGQNQYKAEVITVSEMPNLETLTYPLQLGLENFRGKLYVGMPLTTCIYTGNSKGISIPITAIISDGEDYVYCVSNGRAIQKNISIKDVYQQYVHVDGLAKGDTLITKGIKNVQPGTKVAINE